MVLLRKRPKSEETPPVSEALVIFTMGINVIENSDFYLK